MSNMSIHLISPEMKLRHGLSFWKVTLDSGKHLREDQVVSDLLRGTRSVNWHLDIAATNDCAHIKELTLCTPAGERTLGITDPYTAFQFSQGTMSIMSGGRRANAQIIGRVDDKEIGTCTCIIWNAVDQILHVKHVTNIHNFTSWRRGTPDLGIINYQAMGVRL